MPTDLYINLAYDELYDDYDEVEVLRLIQDIPTKMALALICHYTGQLHTEKRDQDYQIQCIDAWSKRLDDATIHRINEFIKRIKAKSAHFALINNISSLYLIECLLEHHNNLPEVKTLTTEQEENLFKAYIFFTAKWTKDQEVALKGHTDSLLDIGLLMVLPFSELTESKDFTVQFMKAVYFFKFCESNDLFRGYLAAFLEARTLPSWNQYLFNLVSTYMTLLQPDQLKTVLDFPPGNDDIFAFLENFCTETTGFKTMPDFMLLREKPVYRYGKRELLFLNINFLIDKIYQGVIFDFANILVAKGLTYNGKQITDRRQFLGIYGDEFIEPGLFFKLMQSVFRQKDYSHFTGDGLKESFGDGVPDYLILDNRKIYVFEFKNALFSGPVKYSYDMTQIKKELNKKLVANEQGKPKGVTQLVNFIEDITKGRYERLLGKEIDKYIIYPVLVTTDFTFTIPVIYTLVSEQYKEILNERKLNSFHLNIHPLTMMDLDTIIKFQDLFIQRKLTLNHVFNDYQSWLRKGKDPIEQSLSFSKYMQSKTTRMIAGAPKMFLDEIRRTLF